jgi:DNA-directed RNA polymerase sigma subunit (sigma70/sigma32)
LVEPNLALVVSVAQKHPSDHIRLLDVIITGNDALMTAVRAFADSNADNFSALAAPYVEGAIHHVVTTRDC